MIKKLFKYIKRYWNWYIISKIKPYHISIVGEMILNRNFLEKHGHNWAAGRIEVYSDGPYADEEIRYFTNKKEFIVWRDKNDFRNYTKTGIEKLRDFIEKNYNNFPEN